MHLFDGKERLQTGLKWFLLVDCQLWSSQGLSLWPPMIPFVGDASKIVQLLSCLSSPELVSNYATPLRTQVLRDLNVKRFFDWLTCANYTHCLHLTKTPAGSAVSTSWSFFTTLNPKYTGGCGLCSPFHKMQTTFSLIRWQKIKYLLNCSSNKPHVESVGFKPVPKGLPPEVRRFWVLRGFSLNPFRHRRRKIQSTKPHLLMTYDSRLRII